VSKYFDFRLTEKKPKTSVFDVLSKHHLTLLGKIRWYSPWRQYVFEPSPDTIWNKDCLRDVSAFLLGLMLARKEKSSDPPQEASR